MQTVSELLEAQRRKASGDKNKDIWGDVFYNVKLSGAKGDGVTDDTNAIADALAYAQENAIKLFFPPGTYLVDQILYGTVPYANQISIEGADRDLVTLKKKTSDSNPLFVVGSASGTNFTSNITISNMTFQGITGNTPSAFRAYDLVRSKFENCRFTGGFVGLEMLGGIANNVENCLFDFNGIGWKLDKFTSLSGGGYPNLNTAYSSLFLDNTVWGVYFDNGRLLNLDNCEIEGNGTASDITTGGLYVGTGVGSESGLLDIGVNVKGSWLEANVGIGGIQFNSGRNSVSQSYFVGNTGTYDIHIKGGRYHLEFCDGDTVKAFNVFEEATVTNGNYIMDSDFASLSYDNSKTMIWYSGSRFLMRNGEVPVITGVAKPLIQQGIDTTAAGVVTVTFTDAFTSPPNVQVTMNNDSVGTLDVPEVYAVTNLGFTVRKKSITSGSATVGTTNAGFYWCAIGQK